MRLRLKEDPKEWRRFALVASAVLALISALACRRGLLPFAVWLWVLAAIASCLLAASVWPRLARPVYRLAMTVSFHLGQVVGRVLLALVFFLVVTPLGWALRLTGKDLLHLRRQAENETYWHPAPPPGSLDRSF